MLVSFPLSCRTAPARVDFIEQNIYFCAI